MNLPCLLDDKMKPRADLHPIRLTVDRSLQPLSMAEMVLPPEDAPVCVRDFVRLCDGFGDDEIYRVSSISEEPGLRRVVQLEHGMATLADDMLPALTYAENVQTILKRILSYQTRIRWRVGDVEADEGLVISAIGQTQSIYAALTSLLDMLPPNLCWAFDQTKLPWKLHLRKLPEEISCEGRLTRNISTVRVTRDASRLCTRVFPYGCGQGLDRVTLTPLLGREYIDAADTKTWGIAARTFTSDQIMDADTLYPCGICPSVHLVMEITFCDCKDTVFLL